MRSIKKITNLILASCTATMLFGASFLAKEWIGYLNNLDYCRIVIIASFLAILAMAFRVADLQGLAGMIVARRACASAALTHQGQKSFYETCDAVLQPLYIKVHKLLRSGGKAPPLAKCVAPSHILLKCKCLACTEPSFPIACLSFKFFPLYIRLFLN